MRYNNIMKTEQRKYKVIQQDDLKVFEEALNLYGETGYTIIPETYKAYDVPGHGDFVYVTSRIYFVVMEK